MRGAFQFQHPVLAGPAQKRQAQQGCAHGKGRQPEQRIAQAPCGFPQAQRPAHTVERQRSKGFQPSGFPPQQPQLPVQQIFPAPARARVVRSPAAVQQRFRHCGSPTLRRRGQRAGELLLQFAI